MPSIRRVLSCAQAVARIHERSFPDDADDLVGVELEWLVRSGDATRPAEVDHRRLGDLVLPGGSALTIEPGGQLELSSRPRSSVAALCADVAGDVSDLGDEVSGGGARLVGMGLAPEGPTPRLASTPRYDAMDAFFAPDGPAGSIMMTATASLQVNLGLGGEAEVEGLWRRANILGPVLAAVFANSPLRDGAPTGWASTRLQVWSAIDPSRTASAWAPGRGCASWADYVLDARVMLICRSGTDFAPLVKPLSFRRWLTQGHELGYPTAEDLDYHLTTLFPPVRPKGWLELRFLDALPPPWWPVATAVAAGLVRDPEAGARAERAADPFAGQWRRAARFGLADPGLASAAQECFAAAAGTLTDGDSGLGEAVVEYAQRFVARGRTPADERLDAWRATGSSLLAEDAERVAVMAR